ncbi:TPA: hypothetical protein ACGOOQ_001755 [Streptococcus suis]
MKIRVPKANSVSFWLLASLLAAFTLEILVQTTIINDSSFTKVIQYLLLFIPIFLCSLQVVFNNIIGKKSKKSEKLKFGYELKRGIFLGIVFLLSTLWYSYSASRFSLNSILEVFQITFPFIFTFVVINFLDRNNLHSFMKFALLIVCVGLLFDEGDKLLVFSNYIKVSILNSYSPFENSIFPQFAAPLGVYFIYNMKKSPYMTALALFINFLIFKRVLLIMLFLLFFFKLLNLDDRWAKLGKLTYIYAVFWFLIVSLTYYMYLPENSPHFERLLNVDFAHFTVGRIYRFWYVHEQGFSSYGLGSAREFLFSRNLAYVGYDFELDFIKTMFEIGPIAVATYILTMVKICRQNLYALAVVNFYFLNFLMANGMYQYWSLIFILITIACINYGSNLQVADDYNYESK